jgi:hypothetical protein
VVRLRGYRPLAISAGLAVVLAELVKTCFTGIGMVFGASKCEAVVVHQGIELVRCMVPRGGDWIDEQVARECGDVAWDAAGESFLDIDCACRRKEEFHGNLAHPAGELAYLLARLYRELVADLLEQTSQKLSRCRNASEIPRSASIVYAGGATRIGGFSGLVEQMLPAATFPLKICNVLLANDSDYTVARGCLINAELETVTLARVKAA